MKIDSNVSMTGRLVIELNDEVVQEVDNLVVTAGKNWVASRMAGTSSGVMSHMGIGTSTTAAAAAQTALVSQHSDGRNALASAGGTVGSGASANTVTFAATFAAGECTDAITEAGIFNASSGGDMLCRTVFAVVNKGASDSMTITWTVTAS